MRAALRLCARPRRGVACQAAGCDMAARVCCGCNFWNTLPARARKASGRVRQSMTQKAALPRMVYKKVYKAGLTH